jgi:Putative collagen-binding domain of a collagenase
MQALLGVLGVIFSLFAAPVAAAPLAVDTNPHYFTGLDGAPVLFLSHSANSVTNVSPIDADWQWYLDAMAASGLNLVKLIGQSTDVTGTDRYLSYVRVPGGGNTAFGHDKLDLDQINPEFLKVLAAIAAYAEARGIYVQVQIWNHISLKTGSQDSRWDGCVWNPNNTVTDTAAYGFPGSGGNGAPTFYASLSNTVVVDGKTLLDRQNEFFDAIVGATKGFENVYYELGLEVTTSSTAWARHWTDRLATIAPGKLMIVDTKHYTGDASFFDGYTVHNASSDDDSVPQALYALGKMGIEDTDWTCDWAAGDLGKMRRTAWFAVLSGVHFVDFRCESSLLSWSGTDRIAWLRPEVPAQLGHVASFFSARAVPFARMVPDDAVSSSGAEVLAGDGFVVAFSTAPAIDLDLPAGNYIAEWYNPRTGVFKAAGAHSGGNQHFELPTTEDWVLLLRAAATDSTPRAPTNQRLN